MTFKEVVAATDPKELARLRRGEKYDDPAVADPFQREVRVHEDRHGNGEWRVEYFDDSWDCGPSSPQKATKKIPKSTERLDATLTVRGGFVVLWEFGQWMRQNIGDRRNTT